MIATLKLLTAVFLASASPVIHSNGHSSSCRPVKLIAPESIVTSCNSCSWRSPRCLIAIVAPRPNPDPTRFMDFMLARNLNERSKMSSQLNTLYVVACTVKSILLSNIEKYIISKTKTKKKIIFRMEHICRDKTMK